MTRAYGVFCVFERWLTAILLLAIALLVFLSAIARTLGHPLNWAVDISMLIFAWMVFLGGDVVIRETNLISVDLFQNMLPPAFRKWLNVVFYLMMIVFLLILVRYGIPLLIQNWKRMFQATEISYSWCTLSVPVGSALMIVSLSAKLLRMFREPAARGGN
ncbi:MAG: TRAP transporter small permease subunit [Planctomycetota bacterium]|jgi:TRAP-type C4-dicarboxylate transport system permease small subunit|nr:TRAP transporter small permease subunit [Planctomycetota bacterium]